MSTTATNLQNKVTLRPLKVTDIDDKYVNWWKNKDFTRYLETKKLTKQDAINHLRDTQSNGGFLCAVEANGVHVGNVKVSNEHDLSIIIFPPYWGQGYATVAINKMIKAVGGYITAGVRSENVASLRAFEKAGFTQTGRTQDIIHLAINLQ